MNNLADRIAGAIWISLLPFLMAVQCVVWKLRWDGIFLSGKYVEANPTYKAALIAKQADAWLGNSLLVLGLIFLGVALIIVSDDDRGGE